jgi:hypothetical protein
MEDKMNKGQFSLIAATFVGLSAFAMSSLSAQAGMTEDLGKCRFYEKEKVIACCNRIIHYGKKRPLWMMESESSCQTAAYCVPKKYGRTYLGKPRCYIQVRQKIGGGGSSTPALTKTPNQPSVPPGKD